MTVRFTSAAERELHQAMLYYETAEKGLGARFLHEVEETLNRIEAQPLAWTKVTENIRRCRVHTFPYAVFYQVRANELMIMCIADLRRNPERWRVI